MKSFFLKTPISNVVAGKRTIAIRRLTKGPPVSPLAVAIPDECNKAIACKTKATFWRAPFRLQAMCCETIAWLESTKAGNRPSTGACFAFG